ncbi:MAG: hypothetical protein HYX29_11630 [Solirubrobacterales bacterium]|nr:hypothetical protein [Solirubrobacterales bacterium]
MSVVGVAAIIGHSPAMCLSTHAHVIADLDPDDRKPASALIDEARREVAQHANDD